MSRGDSGSASGRRVRIWVPFVVGVLSLAVTITAWRLLTTHQEELLAARFQLQSEERFRAIEARLAETLGAVYVPQAVQEATTTSETVRVDEFRALARTLSKRYPGLEALAWAP